MGPSCDMCGISLVKLHLRFSIDWLNGHNISLLGGYLVICHIVDREFTRQIVPINFDHQPASNYVTYTSIKEIPALYTAYRPGRSAVTDRYSADRAFLARKKRSVSRIVIGSCITRYHSPWNESNDRWDSVEIREDFTSRAAFIFISLGDSAKTEISSPCLALTYNRLCSFTAQKPAIIYCSDLRARGNWNEILTTTNTWKVHTPFLTLTSRNLLNA